ncbi:hypothetical protein JCM3765_003330 [Sporobolomyces pararoseus]
MSRYDTQSVSSRSTSSGFPNSLVNVKKEKREAGFVAPNSRRGGRDFKVVQKQKSDVSTGVVKKDKSGKSFRRTLGELIAGRNHSKDAIVVVREDQLSQPRIEIQKPLTTNKTTEWVQEEARRSHLRERELNQHETERRSRNSSALESLDDQSFYASSLQGDSDEFPAPPVRGPPNSQYSLSTFPNLSQLSLDTTYLETCPREYSASRASSHLDPATSDFLSRRLSSRSSPQLRPLLLPQNLPTDPLPPLPLEQTPVKLATFPSGSLPATPPASPPIESSPFVSVPRSNTSRSLPSAEANDSVVSPSPATSRVQASHRRSFLPPPTSLGLVVTTTAPLIIASPSTSSISPTQKKLDTTTRMLLKALSFDLVYLAKISSPSSFSSSPQSIPTLDILSSSGMPRPQPKFDPELHLSALRSPTGLLYHCSEMVSFGQNSYKVGVLVPVVSMRKVGFLLCAYSKDEMREVGERELKWIGKFAEELEGVVMDLSSHK